MNINLELYKVFYYVAKNGSFSRAANELSISQPAISKSIKTLEEQVNVKFFIRKRDGVVLTDAGQTIYNKIKEAMELINSAENDLKSIIDMKSGTINIGASKTILHEFLMPHIKSFHEKNPKITIRIFTDKTGDLIKKAKIGLVDVIFTNLPFSIPSDFKEYKIMDLHDCLVVNNKYSFLLNKKMTIKDLEKLPLLVLTKGSITRIRFDDYCTENNVTIHPEMEFGSNTLIKEFTEAGFGVGMLTEEHIKEELRSGKLIKLNLELSLREKYLGMVWNELNNSFVVKNFISYIKERV